MRRTCDGTDPNLTREFTTASDDLAAVDGATVSPWDRGEAGRIVIQCNCGLSFDDAERRVDYPHEWLPAPVVREGGGK